MNSFFITKRMPQRYEKLLGTGVQFFYSCSACRGYFFWGTTSKICCSSHWKIFPGNFIIIL
jgi:hypothetical protein